MNDNDTLAHFPGNSASFRFRQKITGSAVNDGTRNVEIMVWLKYWSSFRKTLEMSFLNCEINLIITWSENWVISNAAANQATAFAITDLKLHVLVITLSTDDNGKLLEQLIPGSSEQLTGINMKQKQQDRMLQTNPFTFSFI